MAKINDAIIAERNEKVKRGGNRMLASLLALFIGGYFFFFSSNVWMPPAYEDITVTPLGSTLEQSSRRITLLSWTWDEETRKQEIMLDIKNASTDGVDAYRYEAKDINKGTLDIEVVCQAPDFVVLRLVDVPGRWTELSLRIMLPDEEAAEGEEEKLAVIKMYTTKEAVARAGIGEKQSEAAYRSQACDIRIASINRQIDQTLAEIKESKETIANAKERIEQLKAEKAWQTESEQAETLSMITELQGDIAAADSDQEEAGREIKELQEQIRLQEKLKEKYEAR